MALAISTVAGFEGLRLNAYRDVVGVPTACFGETRGVKMGDRYTLPECRDMLGVRLGEFAIEVEKCLTAPAKLPPKTYVAFVSTAYNIGSPAFCKSSIARRANAGDLRGACDAILAFNKGGKPLRVIPGLTNRRQEERALCLADL